MISVGTVGKVFIPMMITMEGELQLAILTRLTRSSLAAPGGPITGLITLVCTFPALNRQARQLRVKWRGATSGVRDPGLAMTALGHN